MAASDSMTVTLSGELAARVRAMVESGEFPSEADVIESGIDALDESLTIEPWQMEDARESLAEYKADPSTGLTSAQVQANLRAQYESMLKQG